MTAKKLFSAGIVFLFLLPGLAYGAELDLGVSYLNGTTEKKGLDVSLEAEKGTMSGSARVRYAEEDEAVSENRGHLSLGYDPAISDQWFLWFYEQAGYDEMREIALENFAGGGPKYTFVNRELLKVSLSYGVLQHYTEYEDGLITDVARWSLRPKMRWQMSDRFSIQAIVFYQPAIEDFDDYIVTGEASLKYRLTEKVGLKVKMQDEYRSVSLVGYKNDVSTMLALSINF